jgi:hypothetical protein
LQEIVLVAEQLQHESKGFRGRVKEMFKTGSIAEKIAGYQQQMQRLQSNCMVNIYLHIQGYVLSSITVCGRL